MERHPADGGLSRRAFVGGLGAAALWGATRGVSRAAPGDGLATGGVFSTGVRAGTPTTGRGDGTPAAVEFLGGAITSNGLLDGQPPGPARDAAARALEQQGRAVNTHFAFLDLLSKGYGVLEASADELLVEYRSPESILTPSSPMRTLQRFRVLPDRAAIELR